MSGTWVRKKAYWWQYYLPDMAHPVADVLQRRAEGPQGGCWDALLVSGMRSVVEGVSLEDAKAAIERHATPLGDPAS